MRPPIQYARSGDLKIAYQITGGGPIDLIWAPAMATQLDLEWDWPPRARFLESFGTFCRLIRFDKRGAAPSNPPLPSAPPEDRLNHPRPVLDAAALAHEAFALCSQPAGLLRALLVPSEIADDIAIVTVRIGGGADWSLDASDARVAQAARAEFVTRLAAAGVPNQARLSCEVIFGEIVGNVARYTPGPVDLALRREGGAVVLRALDRGPAFAWRARQPDADSENGRGLFLIDALARAVHCEHLAGFGTYLAVTLDV